MVSRVYQIRVVVPDACQSLEHQIWVDRTRSVTEQQREVMHLARFARLHHDVGFCTSLIADQMMVHRRCGKQRWKSRRLRVDTAVRQNQYRNAIPNRRRCLVANSVQSRLEPADSVFHREQSRYSPRRDTWLRGLFDARQVRVSQHRMIDPQDARVRFGLVEQVRTLAYRHRHLSHQRLPYRIQRRIGHLSKVLLEVGEQVLRLV